MSHTTAIRGDAAVTERATGDRAPIDRRVRRAATTGGAALLAMTVAAGFGYGVAVSGLVTEGDAVRTTVDIGRSAALFRAGIAALLAVAALDVVVAWALYRVLEPARRRLALLAAGARTVYAGIFVVAIAQLVDAARLASATAAGTAPVQQAVMRHVDRYGELWNAGLALFGLHLLLVGYLAVRSGFVPHLLGILVAVAGAGYVFDSGVTILAIDAPTVGAVTFVGEVLLGVWLLAWPRRRPAAAS